jgi:hypothetical protein
VARYLSAEWFALVSSAPLPEPALIVLEQVVRDTPDGAVTYRVEVGSSRARVMWPVPADASPADLRIMTDWATAVSVARGDLSTQRALMQGRFRVSGSPDQLAGATSTLAGFDPVPAGARENTTFGE